MRPQIQEVGPHGWEVEGRLGGLQAWGRRNGVIDSAPRTEYTNDEGQQTVPKDSGETKDYSMGKGKAKYPPPTPRLPYDNSSLLWGTL